MRRKDYSAGEIIIASEQTAMMIGSGKGDAEIARAGKDENVRQRWPLTGKRDSVCYLPHGLYAKEVMTIHAFCDVLIKSGVKGVDSYQQKLLSLERTQHAFEISPVKDMLRIFSRRMVGWSRFAIVSIDCDGLAFLSIILSPNNTVTHEQK